jgi:hypothetical protein
MSNIDKRALREAAEKAGSDKWQAKKINGDFYVIRNGSYEKQHGFTSYQPIAEIEHKPVRDFVAAANPAVVLALLDELEAKDKRIAELEAREVKLPELKMLRDYLAEVTHREREDILVGVRLEFFRALEEVGVKVAAAAGKGEAS